MTPHDDPTPSPGPTPQGAGDSLQAGIEAALRAFVPDAARSDRALLDLLRYVEQLLEANRTINLVSRRNTEAHVLRFVRESLFLVGLLVEDAERLPSLERPVRLLDIGSGGGFPGLIAKIVLPGVETFLVDATRKKAAFLAQVARDLDLEHCTVLWARTEDLLNENHAGFRPETRHGFEWVTTKAVGSLEQSIRLALPFLDVGGVHWTFKGATLEDELSGCRRLFKQARLQRLRTAAIPGDAASWVVGIRRLPPATPRS